MQRLDHGVLNIPLSKRGNIDNQIDAYKSSQAKGATVARKAAAQLLVEQRMKAKAIIAGMSDERIAAMAAKHATTTSKVLQMLKSIAYFTPAQLIKTEFPGSPVLAPQPKEK